MDFYLPQAELAQFVINIKHRAWKDLQFEVGCAQ